MTRPTHESLLGALALSVALVGVAHAQPTERANPLVLAQAPPPMTEQEKAKRNEQERKKGWRLLFALGPTLLLGALFKLRSIEQTAAAIGAPPFKRSTQQARTGSTN